MYQIWASAFSQDNGCLKKDRKSNGGYKFLELLITLTLTVMIMMYTYTDPVGNSAKHSVSQWEQM
jgi:hypothetical protein